MLAITLRDESMQWRGQIYATKVQAVLKPNTPDTFVVDVAPDSLEMMARLRPGWGLIIRDGDTVISGDITELRQTAKDHGITYEISGVGDLHHLADRITYPDPVHSEAEQSTATWKGEGPAETVIKDLVSLNAGERALPERRVRGLIVETSAGRGEIVKTEVRLKSLLETAANLAREGRLLMQTHPIRGGVRFTVEPVRDLSKRVRLTSIAGEVTGWELSDHVGTVNTVIVGGQGTGADRTLVARTRSDEWHRRIEIFKDRRDTDEAGALEKAAAEELDKGEAERTLKLTTFESVTRRLGEDFRVGDIISVQLTNQGTVVKLPVAEAKITWENYARSVELTLGGLEKSARDVQLDRMRRELYQLTTI